MSDIHDTSLETLKLLKNLIEHNSICTSQLNTILNNDKLERSNLRHFKTIQYFFKKEFNVEIFQKSLRGYYEVVNKEVLRQSLNFTDKKALLNYVKILKEILPNYYEKLDGNLKKEIESSSEKSKALYHFHNNPIEYFSNKYLLKEIEQSIIKKRKVNFIYKNINYTDAKPLQIVFIEGNLYLAILTSEELNSGFKFLRINYIQDYKVLSIEYNEIANISKAHEFLKEFQIPFAWFDSEYKQVKIFITEYAKEFFKLKNYYLKNTKN